MFVHRINFTTNHEITKAEAGIMKAMIKYLQNRDDDKTDRYYEKGRQLINSLNATESAVNNLKYIGASNIET